uniref:Uncharacterized protein n=1 Tax=Nelumbo nucifera TaxID=4432 RepID=A0A822Z2B4_NELNU|nr:TPA_asm: hypothetical protein HUJ06_012975 [Nelumbo nucifera]
MVSFWQTGKAPIDPCDSMPIIGDKHRQGAIIWPFTKMMECDTKVVEHTWCWFVVWGGRDSSVAHSNDREIWPGYDIPSLKTGIRRDTSFPTPTYYGYSGKVTSGFMLEPQPNSRDLPFTNYKRPFRPSPGSKLENNSTEIFNLLRAASSFGDS